MSKKTYIIMALSVLGALSLACGKKATKPYKYNDSNSSSSAYAAPKYTPPEGPKYECTTYDDWKKVDKSQMEPETISILNDVCIPKEHKYKCAPSILAFCVTGQSYAANADTFELKKSDDPALLLENVYQWSVQMIAMHKNQWSNHIYKKQPSPGAFIAVVQIEASERMAAQKKLIVSQIKALPKGEYKKAIVELYAATEAIEALATNLGGYSYKTYSSASQKAIKDHKAIQSKMQFLDKPKTAPSNNAKKENPSKPIEINGNSSTSDSK